MKTFRTSHILALAAMVILLAGISVRADLPPRQTGTGEVKLTPEQIQKFALDIDKFIGDGFREKEIRPVGEATDEQFLRRTYLTIVGRIPTYEEAIAFLDSDNENKKAELVDQLIDSPARISHDFNYWADVLRATTRFANNRTDGTSYLMYLKRSLAQNKPYDQWVKEMLTASGGGWERGENAGAVGYFERDKGMPLDNMANTMQIFLGTRMECAQCHNHPFNEKISQKDFFHTAAFTNGMQPVIGRDMRGAADIDRRKDRELYALSQEMRYNIFDFGLKGGGDGQIKLPKDYQYKDADPGEMVGMKTMFGDRVGSGRPRDVDDSREQFAEWLASPENPNFTKVIANRMWKRVMGYGVIEPVDNLDSDFSLSNPKLMDYLSRMMVDLKYNVVEYRRVLHNTRTYRQQPNTGEHSSGDPYYFQGRLLSRMTAEQIWDSLLTAIVPNLDQRRGPHYTPFFKYRGRPVFVGEKDMYDIYEEVINLKGGQYVSYLKKMLEEIEADSGGKGKARGKGKGSDEEAAEMAEMAEMNGGGDAAMTENDPRWASYPADLLRASELPSPTPGDHFLRKFGQSARDVIEGSTKESDVTQILSLINGQINSRVIGNSNAVLYQEIEKAETAENKLDVAFLSILTRRPSADEKELFLANIEKNGAQGYDNMVWALFNSSEFMFLQ